MNQATHPVEQEEVMAYLDGELPAERAAELAGHLQECAHCAALAADLRGISQQVLGWQVEPAADALADVVSEAAKKPRKQAREVNVPWSVIVRTRPRWQRLAYGFAGVGVLAVVSMVVWTGHSRRQIALQEARRSPSAFISVDDGLRGQGGGSSGGGERIPSRSMDSSRAAATKRKAESEMADNFEINGKPQKGDTDDIAHALLYKPPRGLTDYSGTAAPMVARTASLTITVKDFAATRALLERIVAQFHGYIGELTTESPKDAAQTLTATLRIPAPQLDAALAELKALGRVEQEQQGGEEVSEQHADLVARLKNARATEQSLLDVLRQRTGKVSEVLEVEEQIANTRGEIERMEAEQKGLEKRISYGTVQLKLNEEYKAALNFAPPSTLTSLRNAAADGYHTLVESLLGLILWLESYAPVLVFWGFLLFWPARRLWRRIRAGAQPAAQAPSTGISQTT
jgi:hypothetical protein